MTTPRAPNHPSCSLFDDEEPNESPSRLLQRTPTPNPSLVFRSLPTSSLLRSFLPICLRPSFPVPSPFSSPKNKLIGTLFGPRKGHVTFSIQSNLSSPPIFLLEFPFTTSHFTQEMASGNVRILLECWKPHVPKDIKGKLRIPLWEEPVWSMYCNGRRRGYTVSRKFGDYDKEVFGSIKSVSAGAGVMPLMKGSEEEVKFETMFMRARFERVVGNKDSEAFYMMSPHGGRNGAGTELSIFLLRL